MKSIASTIKFLLLVAILWHSCKPHTAQPIAVSSETKPNIVLIFSDDHAWYDYGFMGHEIAQTANLDRLAAEGIVFPRGYVPTAICRPSLMTMATGLFPHQHMITGNDPGGGFDTPRFPREDLLENIDKLPTLPRILVDNGYLAHQSGKWWEGDYSRGGFTHGMTKGRRHGDEGLKIGREGMDSIYRFVEYAVSENKPFYLWYAPFLPHTPHNPPERLLTKYVNQELTISVAKYYAMVEWLDETIGQLIDFLEEKNLLENTLIYYLCDNGWIQKPDANGFANGSKQSAMEGGVRTPILFSWPGKLKPAIRDELISSIDFMPTLLAAAGIDPPANLPGLNLWDNLISGEKIDRQIIFGEGYGHNMIDKDNPEASLAYRWCVEGHWKLILCYDGEIEGWGSHTHEEMRTQPVRLYNIVKDPYEKTNLAKRYPEEVERLTRKIEDWNPLKDRKVLEKS